MSDIADDRAWWFSLTGEDEQAVRRLLGDDTFRAMLSQALDPYSEDVDKTLVPDDVADDLHSGAQTSAGLDDTAGGHDPDHYADSDHVVFPPAADEYPDTHDDGLTTE